MTTLCQQLQISHCRLLLEYPRFAMNVTIGTAHTSIAPYVAP